MIGAIDHVGIAVNDLDAALGWHNAAFGVVPTMREVIESEGVEEAMLSVGGSFIQLLATVRDDSPVARFLGSRGEGLHHIAYRVDNLAATLDRLRTADINLIDEVPRPGGRNTMIAFIHPKGNLGTLTELVEYLP